MLKFKCPQVACQSFQSKIDAMRLIVAATATKTDHFCSLVEQAFVGCWFVGFGSAETTLLAEEVLDRPGMLDTFEPMSPNDKALNRMILSLLDKCKDRPVSQKYFDRFVSRIGAMVSSSGAPVMDTLYMDKLISVILQCGSFDTLAQKVKSVSTSTGILEATTIMALTSRLILLTAGIIFVRNFFVQKREMFTFSRAHSQALTNYTRRHENFRGLSRLFASARSLGVIS